ncbi:hypothetical protein DL769_004817 [Monosporascus sp. CRB-8-3]|nr:hypothetical protein DL769_004817 [Monosporascus sp. CRB-8-3]
MNSLDRMEDDFMEDVFLQDGLCPTIAEHATQCNSLFHRYMAVPEIVPDPTVMDDQLARFTLWASNMDVYGPLNVSLDYRLRFSPTVVEIIHQLLDVICDTLTSLKPIDDPPQTPSRKRQRISEHGDSEVRRRADDDDASDSDSDVDQAEENISKITDTIGGTVTRLFRLSNAVRKSAKANRARKIERYRDDEEANKAIAELRLYTECYIRFRFPMAPDSLRSALVEANALRLRRLYYQRSHRRRIDLTWISHMQNAHGHTWECRAPSHDPIIFDQEIQYREHSIKEHGVPETHAGTLSSAARRPVLDKVLECPFGDDFQPPEKVESSAVFSSEALQLHVAAHIKEIALLTLQKLPSDVDENAENIDSDQPLEDDGPGFVKLRGSMYSILDDEALDFQDDAEAANAILDHRGEDISPSLTRLDLEDKDDSGMTKLHHAVQAGNLRLAESLIYGGANLGSRDNGGRTALHYACMEQSHGPDIMTLLLNAGGKAIMNLGDANGQTALHYAAERDFTDGIHILLDHGVDPRTTDNHGFSPCLWAVVAGQTRATDKLLTIGADANSTSADGRSALAWAAGLGWSSIAGLLVNHGASMSRTRNTQMVPLEEAAASGDFLTVQLLLRFGGDPNYRDRDGWSAIHWAAEEGHLEIVRLLLNEGANVNAVSSYEDDRIRSSASQQDNHGWSVLHLAIHSRDLATVDVLLGSSVIAEPRALLDESGLTAEEWLDLGPTSHSYKATSNVPMIKLLFRLGHTVNDTNSGRRTALYYAAKKRMLSIMDLLLDRGADPNILPAGRKTWEEFISDDDVLLRLDRAGYAKRDTDPEVKRQIRLALRAQGQPSVPDRSASFVPGNAIFPGSFGFKYANTPTGAYTPNK